MLSIVKMDHSRIRKALLSLDDNSITVDGLKAISKQLPTFEEVRKFDVCFPLKLK